MQFLLLTAVFGMSLGSSAAAESVVDGVWGYDTFRCETGEPVLDYALKADDFATYTVDTGAGTMRIRSRLSQCSTTMDYDLKVDGTAMSARRPRLLESSCPTEVVDEDSPVEFAIRKKSTGEYMLDLTIPPGDSCTENGVGHLLLKTIPEG